MTALAMIIGMLPMSLGLGEGGEHNAPLGRAVIGGLLFATVATLFFVPVTFSIVHGAREKKAAPAAQNESPAGLDERSCSQLREAKVQEDAMTEPVENKSPQPNPHLSGAGAHHEKSGHGVLIAIIAVIVVIAIVVAGVVPRLRAKAVLRVETEFSRRPRSRRHPA